MATTQTLSMTEIHQRASRRLALRASPTPYGKVDISSLPKHPKTRELRRPTLPRDGEEPTSPTLISSWLDGCYNVNAISKIAEESKDDHPVEDVIQNPKDTPLPFTDDRHQNEPEPSNSASRLNLEERCAALRQAVEQPSSKLEANAADEDESSSDEWDDPSEDNSDDSTTNDESEPEAPDIDLNSHQQYFGLRTSVTSETYLTEVYYPPGGISDEPKFTYDTLEFTVLDEDMNPLPTNSWVSVVPAGSIATGLLQKGHIRRHAAAKFDADLRSLGLWYDNWPSESEISNNTDTETQIPRRIGVKILLDPYISLIYAGDVYALDYSSRYYQKVDLSIGMIRKDAKATLNVSPNQELSLFYQGRELIDDRLPLKAAVALSKNICQGFERLYISATVELKYKDCIVCGDELHIETFMSKPFTSACTHEVNTCTPCLRRWLEESLTSRGYDKISCPECSAPFQHLDVKACASKQQFKRYDSLATRAVLSVMENFHWCMSPKCESGQIHHDDSPIFVCTACHFKQCLRHEAPWHEGETCREYDYRVSGRKKKDEEERSRQTIQRISKQCPGARCGARIQKNQGCDHMTCRKCKHEFCWVCLAEYGPIRRHGNRMHKRNCRHYSDWDTTGDVPAILIP